MQSNNKKHCGDTNFFHLGVGEGGIGEKKRESSIKDTDKQIENEIWELRINIVG